MTSPSQVWMQPPATPNQLSNMDIDDNALQSTEPKSLLTTKKGKGKKKASKVFICHQKIQETEENLA